MDGTSIVIIICVLIGVINIFTIIKSEIIRKSYNSLIYTYKISKSTKNSLFN